MVFTRSSMSNVTVEQNSFESLPTEVMEHILGYLSYKTICHVRLVSKKMNVVCRYFLTHSFQKTHKKIPVNQGCSSTIMVFTRSSISNNTWTEQNLFESLPPEVLEHILGYLSYETIGRMRLISTKMNGVCGDFLTHSFQKMQKKITVRFNSLKKEMPRRDSLRRSHPRSNELEIVDMLQARLSLLQLGMGKHLAQNHCQFFAGEVLDECRNILQYIDEVAKIDRPYKVTEELFDLTSMALDFFKDKIEPTLPELTSHDPCCHYPVIGHSLDAGTAFTSLVNKEPESGTSTVGVDFQLHRMVKQLSKNLKRKNTQLNDLVRKKKTITNKLSDQETQILNLAQRLDEAEKNSAESSLKLAVMKQELDKCKTAMQVWHTNLRSGKLPENYQNITSARNLVYQKN